MKKNIIETDNFEITSKKNFLIIEDEPEIQSILEMYIREIGFNGEFYLASSISQAKELLLNNRVDFILTDKNLPGENPTALTEALRKSTQDLYSIPLLVVSGDSDNDNELLMKLLGADDYLCKPFQFEEFREKVLNVLKRKVEPIDTDSAM